VTETGEARHLPEVAEELLDLLLELVEVLAAGHGRSVCPRRGSFHACYASSGSSPRRSAASSTSGSRPSAARRGSSAERRPAASGR